MLPKRNTQSGSMQISMTLFAWRLGAFTGSITTTIKYLDAFINRKHFLFGTIIPETALALRNDCSKIKITNKQ